MDGEKFDMVWTDPPYNVDYSSKNKALNASGKGSCIQTPIARDNMREGAFEKFLLSVFKNCFDALQSGGPIYVAYAGAQGKAFHTAFAEAGFSLQNTLIWVKNNIVIGRHDYQPQAEPILYGWKPGAAHKWYGGRKERSVRLSDIPELTPTGDGSYQLALANRVVTLRGRDLVAEEIESDVLLFPKPQSSRLHPTMKPVELIERMVINSSQAGDLVGDFFGGSGSTLIACERTGRKCRTIELDPRYCDVIIRRWQDFSGQKAVNAATGKTFGG